MDTHNPILQLDWKSLWRCGSTVPPLHGMGMQTVAPNAAAPITRMATRQLPPMYRGLCMEVASTAAHVHALTLFIPTCCFT